MIFVSAYEIVREALLAPPAPIRAEPWMFVWPVADHHGVEEQRIISNPHHTEEKGKGIRVAEWLVSLKIDVVLVQEDVRGKGPEYVLCDAGVMMRLTDKPTLAEALSSLPH